MTTRRILQQHAGSTELMDTYGSISMGSTFQSCIQERRVPQFAHMPLDHHVGPFVQDDGVVKVKMVRRFHSLSRHPGVHR